MIDELLPNMIKAINILQGHKVSTKKQRVQTQVQNHQSTTHKAKMLHELSPDMIKVIKILQGHKVTTKKQRMQMKAQKQQSTAHNSKNDT